MSEPRRIQRKRTKGWRMPEGAVYVGRPSRWGNPFVVAGIAVYSLGTEHWWTTESESASRKVAVELFAIHTGPMGLYEYDDATLASLRRDLAGRDLACWCPLDQPCHADVLLEIANGASA